MRQPSARFPRDPPRPANPTCTSRGDVILGCGGYDPARSYLIFSKGRHSADHGADESGGVIGKVVSGPGVLDRWSTGDRLREIEPVISWADTSRSFTTTDRALVLEDGMRIVTRVGVIAQGYTDRERVDHEAAGSVEHMLLALQTGRFAGDRATSTHIADLRLQGRTFRREYRHPRREGAVTVTDGRQSGGRRLHLPRPMSRQPGPQHRRAGRCTGIELVRLAQEHDQLRRRACSRHGSTCSASRSRHKEIAAARGIALVIDKDASGERIVVSQDPGTTLEVLAEGR